jgi:hypothetical protein
MITPDGSEPTTRGSDKRSRGLLVGVAALVVLGGLIAIGVATWPEQRNATGTTTSTTTSPEVIPSPVDVDNFTIGQITTGQPLDWELSMAVDDHRPLGLFEHDEVLFLFTDSGAGDGADPGGLRTWRSVDGINWEGIGEVIPADHEVTTVDSTIQGLVATSNRLDDNALVVWESADAMQWVDSEVSAARGDHYNADVASAVGANESTLVVASNTRYDRERLLEDHLREVGVELDLSDLRWNLQWLGEEGHQLIVRGPLGIPLLQQPIEGLSLSDQEREELLSELFVPLGTDLWVRGEDRVWRAGRIGDARSIDSILPSAEGRLVAHGSGASRRVVKISSDGVEWVPGNTSVSPREIEEWERGFVGGINSPELMMSGDGSTWRAAGLSELFPNQMGWSPTALGAGDGGAAMLIRGSRPLPNLPQPMIQELTAEDGSVFTVDANGPGFEVFSDDGRRRWTLDGAALDQGTIEIDPAGETLTLRDPETRDGLATFRFSEIERAEQAHAMATLLYDLSEALAFTPNGQEWVIQDMAPEIGDDTSVSLLEVTASRVVAVVRNTVAGFREDGLPGFEVWSAPLP